MLNRISSFFGTKATPDQEIYSTINEYSTRLDLLIKRLKILNQEFENTPDLENWERLKKTAFELIEERVKVESQFKSCEKAIKSLPEEKKPILTKITTDLKKNSLQNIVQLQSNMVNKLIRHAACLGKTEIFKAPKPTPQITLERKLAKELVKPAAYTLVAITTIRQIPYGDELLEFGLNAIKDTIIPALPSIETVSAITAIFLGIWSTQNKKTVKEKLSTVAKHVAVAALPLMAQCGSSLLRQLISIPVIA